MKNITSTSTIRKKEGRKKYQNWMYNLANRRWNDIYIYIGHNNDTENYTVPLQMMFLLHFMKAILCRD